MEGRKAVKLKCDVAKLCPDAQHRDHSRSKEDSLGKRHDFCFLVVASYIAGETLRPPPRPLPLLIVECFHVIHFISSLTHSSFLPSFFHFHVHFM